MMKIALVHELLTMKGGAERVLRIAADLFPDAPIYTLLYDEKKLGAWFPKERIRTSNLQKWAKHIHNFNHHLYLPFFPKAVEQWDFSEYDIVLSFSSAYTHGIITNSQPRHICYVHSPARYLWDRTHDVQEQAEKGPLGFLRRRYLEHIFHTLRLWDAEVAPRPDTLLAASKAVQRRIELYWERKSTIVYPPIDDFWMQKNTQSPTRDYFFIASTLVPYKRIDLAIEACNTLHLPLKIAGTGPDINRLRKMAGSTVELLGYVEQEELRNLYANAKATLFPGDEDFGLVPLESMSQGTPVIAYAKGGALETVEAGKTGEFFKEANVDSLQEVLQNFDHKKYSQEELVAQAKKFSANQFANVIKNAISIDE